MFTGIIQSVGKIAAIEQKGGDARVRVDAGGLDMAEVNTGDSIAVSGVCLTAVEHSASEFVADVSGETLSRTMLGRLCPGDPVNLEKALTLGTPLGGHLVSGHVDGVGKVASREPEGRSVRFRFEAPAALARYIAEKGSICVDGVSLTVNAVSGKLALVLASTIAFDFFPFFNTSLLTTRYLPGGAFAGIGNKALPA